jgi:branched-chain amino acid transport system substrate-binding protein
VLGRDINRRDVVMRAAALGSIGVLPTRRARAGSDKILRLGVLTDLSSVFTDNTGPGSVLATQMAVEDMGGRVGDSMIEIIAGDYQQKPDVGTAVARQWFDTQAVEAVIDVSNSAVALSVSSLAYEKNKVFLASGNITTQLTGKSCSPNTVHWTIDAYALIHTPVSRLLQQGFDSWFFVTMDVPAGADMEGFATALIKAHGGTVVGSVKHSLNLGDFSALLLQAQLSKAKVIALLNGGTDVINAVKQANEFGIPQGGQKLLAPSAYVTEFHSMGPAVAQGTLLADVFYWDMNAATRSFAARFAARRGGKRPTQFHAGAYAATTHYLKAVAALGQQTDGRAVVAKMKEMATDDPLFGRGRIRADGVTLHPVYLFQIKTPAESTEEWDLYKQLDVVPADQAWRPIEDGGCSLVGKT